MNYFKIDKCDTANGLGFGIVLWVQGCTCNCVNCQNPQTWDFNKGIPFTEEDYNDLFLALEKKYITRLTFSGGHPLEKENIDCCTHISKLVKEKYPLINQWLYTGFKWEEVKDLEIMKTLNILVDGRYEDSMRDITLAFRGSSNQRLIDIQKSIREDKVVLFEC